MAGCGQAPGQVDESGFRAAGRGHLLSEKGNFHVVILRGKRGRGKKGKRSKP
jgi:hypothetical protein